MWKIVLMSTVLAGIFSTSSVWALLLFPTTSKLEVRKGETSTCLLNVSNDDSKPVTCKVTISGFEVQKDGKQLFENANEKYSAAKWLSIKELQIEIPPKSRKEVEVEIKVPMKIEAGDYFACVFVEGLSSGDAQAPQKKIGVSINVQLRMGSFLYLTVLGQTIPKKAIISDIHATVPVLGSKEKDIKIFATLQNKCRLHLDAQGEVFIKNSANNRTVDRFILQGAGKRVKGDALVYPMGEREFSGTMRRPLPAGEYIAEVTFNYGSQFRAKSSTKFQVSEAVGKEQKAFLTLFAEPSLIKAQMSPGAFRVLSLKVSSLEFEPMMVKVIPQSAWIEVEPADFQIRYGHSKSVRVKVTMPAEEQSTMIGKVLLQPEKGKPVVIDIVVSPQQKEKTK